MYRVAAHVVIALIFGYLYLGVGSEAGSVLGNYVYLYGSMLLVVYTGKMSVTLSCKFFVYIFTIILENLLPALKIFLYLG